MMHIIFVFNFHIAHTIQKYFNNEIFVIYGIRWNNIMYNVPGIKRVTYWVCDALNCTPEGIGYMVYKVYMYMYLVGWYQMYMK